MDNVIHANTPARHHALQMLYRNEIMRLASVDDACGSDGAAKDAERPFVVSLFPADVDEAELVGEIPLEYAWTLVNGVSEHLEQIDGWISDTAQNWTIARMPAVDLNIIRLACWEMAFSDEAPVSVAINEAVELAKAYGGDDSPKFVNGVLGRIASMLEDAAQDDSTQVPISASAQSEASEEE